MGAKNVICLCLTFIFTFTLFGCGISVSENNEISTFISEEIQTSSQDYAPSICVEEVSTLFALSDTTNEELDRICNKYGTVGASVSIIKNGLPYAVYCFGTANKSEGVFVCEDTKYRVASLSKLVTDMVFMKLVELGFVNLHDNIEKYLGYKVRNPHYPGIPITPHMLMTHTSSIIDSQTFLNSRLSGSSALTSELLSYKSSYSLNKPGESYIYSNFGIAIIGAICEKVTGKCFDDIAREFVFEPLNIDAGFVASSIKEKDLLGELYGYGGMSVQKQLNCAFSPVLGQTHHIVQGNLTISAKDYSKILCLLLNDGKSTSGNRVLNSKTVKEIKTEHYINSNCGVGYGVEMQWDIIKNKRLYVHTGSNFGMFSAYAFSDDGDGVVILTSGADGTKDIGTGIYKICLEIIQYLL